MSEKSLLGKAILKCCIEADMSCNDLAKQVGVHNQTLSRWIDGSKTHNRIPFETMEQILLFFCEKLKGTVIGRQELTNLVKATFVYYVGDASSFFKIEENNDGFFITWKHKQAEKKE